MPGVGLNGSADIFGDLFTCGSFAEKLDVFFPRERHQNAHPRGSATIEEPARRRTKNPNNVHASLAHQRQIGINLFRPADIISILIRFERTVRDTFDEKLAVPVEKKLRSGTDSRVCLHSVSSLSPCTVVSQSFNYRGSRVDCWAQRRRRPACRYSCVNASRRTAPVRSMS